MNESEPIPEITADETEGKVQDAEKPEDRIAALQRPEEVSHPDRIVAEQRTLAQERWDKKHKSEREPRTAADILNERREQRAEKDKALMLRAGSRLSRPHRNRRTG